MAANGAKTANLRIQWFHKKVTESAYPNAMRLAERFHISHRQAQRDVDFLVRKLGAPLQYSAEHKGYCYSAPFSLPVVITSVGDDNYAIALPGSDELSLFGAESGIVQLQLPFTATVQLSNKLMALELSNYITARRSDDHYICEFHHVEQFLATLMVVDPEVKLLEPAWLRERMVELARRVLAANAEETPE